jgi:hypothetical protein
MEFQFQHRAVKGTPVISLITVMCVVHIQLLARQIHNARTFPTVTATLPTGLRRSLPTRLCCSLSVAALLFSSPTAPCVTTTWIRHPRPRRRANHLRPRDDVDPSPPTITSTTTSFAIEVSPAWTPNSLSLLGHQICYIFISMWIRETCLDSSSFIDCGFDGWILLLQVCLNKFLLTHVVIWTVKIHFHVPGATIFAL